MKSIMSEIMPKPKAAPKSKVVNFGLPTKTPGATKSVEKMQKGVNRSKGKINKK